MSVHPDEVAAEPEIKAKWNTSADIFEILAGQHGEAKAVLARLCEPAANDPEAARERRELGRTLAIELISHNEAETQTLYRRLMKLDDLHDRVEEHRREHEEVNAQLAPLLDGSAEDVEWLERFRALRTAVEAHIADEENKVFPLAKERLNGSEIESLAGDFVYLQDLRKNLMQPV